MRGRWNDWIVLVASLVACSSILWGGMLGVRMAVVFLLAVLMLLPAFLSLTRPELVVSEASLVLLGAVMLVTPWLLGFTDVRAVAATAWGVGAVVLLMGLLGVWLSWKEYRRVNEQRQPAAESAR